MMNKFEQIPLSVLSYFITQSLKDDPYRFKLQELTDLIHLKLKKTITTTVVSKRLYFLKNKGIVERRTFDGPYGLWKLMDRD